MFELNGSVMLETEVIRTYRDYIVFPEVRSNTIWKLNLDQNVRAELVAEIIEEKGKCRCFSDVVIISDDAFLIPFSADAVYRVDLVNGGYEAIFNVDDLLTESKKYNSNAKFMSAQLFGENLYLLPGAFPGIIKINVETGEKTILNEWISKYKLTESMKEFFRKTTLWDKKIIAPFCCARALLFLNCENDEVDILVQDENEKGYCSAVVQENFIIMTPWNGGNLARMETNTQHFNQLDGEVEGTAELVKWGEDVFCVPILNNNNVLLVSDKSKTQEIRLMESVEEYCCATVSENGQLIMISNGIGKCFSSKGEEINNFKIMASKPIEEDYINRKLLQWWEDIREKKIIVEETPQKGLPELIGAVKLITDENIVCQ